MSEKWNENITPSLHESWQNLLWDYYRWYPLEGVDDEYLQTNEELLDYIEWRIKIQQDSRKDREKIRPIIEDRLRAGLSAKTEQEYRIFTEMLQVLHTNAKFPTFQDYQAFIHANESKSLWWIDIRAWYDDEQEDQRTDKIAFVWNAYHEASFCVGYFDITDGKIHEIPLDEDAIDALAAYREGWLTYADRKEFRRIKAERMEQLKQKYPNGVPQKEIDTLETLAAYEAWLHYESRKEFRRIKAERMEQLKQKYPNGVPQEELDILDSVTWE